MCGIFGLVRNLEAAHPERASAVLVELGRHSVERGKDSAGLAFIPRTSHAMNRVNPATEHQSQARVADLDGVIIVKAVTEFGKMWSDEKYLPLLTSAQAVIGHTRWATQGSKFSMHNASPLATGFIVGTHNGDIDTYTVSGHATMKNFGNTDTEFLYNAINVKSNHRRKITDILRDVRGRAALAWVDRRITSRLYLARAALSPLSVAWDAEGNMYWASNPDWFRKIDSKFDGAIGFKDIAMVAEGTLLTIDFAEGIPEIVDMRKFRSTARWTDSLMGDSIVWRGFTSDDTTTDRNQSNHAVEPAAKYSRAAGLVSSRGSESAPTTYKPSNYTSSFGPIEPIDPKDYEWEETCSVMGASEWAKYLNADELDEVQDAVLEWADQGCNHSVVLALQEAESQKDFDRVTKDFAFSSTYVARAFRDDVLSWFAESAV